MNKDIAILFVICFSIAIILMVKYYKYYITKKNMIKIKAKVCDKSIRTGYDRNTYTYYYEFVFKNDTFTTSDKSRFKLPFYNPNIKDEVDILINEKSPDKHITPLTIVWAKVYLFIIILLIIFPFLFII